MKTRRFLLVCALMTVLCSCVLAKPTEPVEVILINQDFEDTEVFPVGTEIAAVAGEYVGDKSSEMGGWRSNHDAQKAVVVANPDTAVGGNAVKITRNTYASSLIAIREDKAIEFGIYEFSCSLYRVSGGLVLRSNQNPTGSSPFDLLVEGSGNVKVQNFEGNAWEDLGYTIPDSVWCDITISANLSTNQWSLHVDEDEVFVDRAFNRARLFTQLNGICFAPQTPEQSYNYIDNVVTKQIR